VYPLFLPRPATISIATEVEEPADRLVHRPLAQLIVGALAASPLTPNHVTLLSGASGVAAAFLIAASVSRPALRFAAAVLLLLAAVLDCADGQLARRRGSSSRGGGALDGLVDEIVGCAVIWAVTYLAVQRYGRWTWLLGAAALISAVVQCLMFDAAKEAYLARFGVAHTASKIVLAAGPRPSAAPPASETLLERLFDGYVQRIRWLASRMSGDRACNRHSARRRVRVWATLGLGTHMACGYVAVATSVFWPPALYGCLLVFATLMNAQMLVLLCWERSVSSGRLEARAIATYHPDAHD
jgi:phosphatidylglycerophosphate synthase